MTLGIIAGYSGGWLDTLLGRLMDLILALPAADPADLAEPVLVLSALDKRSASRQLGPPHLPHPGAGIFGWPYLARIIRGQVLSLREREFVESAVSMGAGTPRILFKEILPNLWAPILVYASLLLPTYIAAEAALSFLGVGLRQPTPSWGPCCPTRCVLPVDPLYLFIPGTVPVHRRAGLQPARRLRSATRSTPGRAACLAATRTTPSDFPGYAPGDGAAVSGRRRRRTGQKSRPRPEGDDMGKAKNGLRVVALASVGALALAACGGGSGDNRHGSSRAAAGRSRVAR